MEKKAHVTTDDTGVLGGHHTVLVVDETHVDCVSSAGLTGATSLGPGPIGPTDKSGTECWVTILGEYKVSSDLPLFSILDTKKPREGASLKIY